MHPNLFLLGFQKCGSSSLFDFLVQHPDIVGSSKKETFALTDPTFDFYDPENSVENDAFRWDKYFTSDARYRLEGSVCNFYQNTAKRYIESLPEAKAIFVVRDPIERFISSYNYYGSSGIFLKPGTSIEDYLKLVEKVEGSIEGIKYALEHGAYVRFIKEWQERLGLPNVLVLSMKEVIKSPETIASKISEFLNIEVRFFPEQMSFKNESRVVKNKRLHLLIRNFFKGKGLGKTKLAKFYMSINRTKPPKISLSETSMNKLKAYYEEEYKELNKLF